MKEKSISESIKDFKAFIRQAKEILPEPRSGLPIAEFEGYIRDANRLAIQKVRKTLEDPRHRDYLKKLCRWIIPSGSDILARAGISGSEDPYTKLIAWMLFPPGEHDLALRCQRAWLKALGLPVAEKIEIPTEPILYAMTDDGIPDIILHYQRPSHVIIIEAKLGSMEHNAPKSKPQTIAYPSAVRRKLGLSADHPVDIIFLTKSGLPAENPDAIATTYDMLVDAIASELSPEELPSDLRWAYSLIITHFLANAVSGNVDRAEDLRKIADWLGGQKPSLTDDIIISELRALCPICRSFNKGVSR